MKQHYSHISMVIDKSGSMIALTNDTIGGVNHFIQEQRKVPGECTMGMTLFDTSAKVLHVMKDIQQMPLLSTELYQAFGNTALIDAVCLTIEELGAQLKNMKEENRPSRVVVVIQTDGEENSSHMFTLEQMKERIKRQEEQYKWEFIFLGANIDAFKTGQSFGLKQQNVMQGHATGQSIRSGWASMNQNYTDLRTGNKQDMSWTSADAKEQDAAAEKS